MAIAISSTNLKEIYNLSYEDKLDLVDLIIKSMRATTAKLRTKTKEVNTSWVSQFDGKWTDSKSAEEMIDDIKNSRTLNSDIIL